MNSNIVYILTNEAMPGLVKIGMTQRNIEERVLELSRASGVPIPFEVFYACEVSDANFVENKLHDAFANNRINQGREFFRIQPERVLAALKLAEIKKDVTPEDDIVENLEEKTALEKIKRITGSFNFQALNIKPGSILTFTRDQNITCIVSENGKSVNFEGSDTSLANAAKIVLEKLTNKKLKWAVSGALYWEHEGVILDDIRNNFLNQEN